MRLVSPTVGLRPTRPLRSEGEITEPSVSVPRAKVTSLAATAPALPVEDPPPVWIHIGKDQYMQSTYRVFMGREAGCWVSERTIVRLYGLLACPPLGEYPSE